MVAIVLLSEIVYWYRKSVVRDPQTGEVIHAKKKFKADKLQRSYQSFADQFGFTKRQVRDAIQFLVDEQYITREFRHIKTEGGIIIPNVMFIEPVVENIRKITCITVPGLRKVRKENAGTPAEEERKHTPELAEKTRVEKRKERPAKIADQNSDAMPEYLYAFYRQNGFGEPDAGMEREFRHWCGELNDRLVLEAMKKAVRYNKRSWQYVRAILRNWREKGYTTLEEVEMDERLFRREKRRMAFATVRRETVPEWLEHPERSRPVLSEEEQRRFERKRKELEMRLKEFYRSKTNQPQPATGSR